jgi:hypothetical protein
MQKYVDSFKSRMIKASTVIELFILKGEKLSSELLKACALHQLGGDSMLALLNLEKRADLERICKEKTGSTYSQLWDQCNVFLMTYFNVVMMTGFSSRQDIRYSYKRTSGILNGLS